MFVCARMHIYIWTYTYMYVRTHIWTWCNILGFCACKNSAIYTQKTKHGLGYPTPRGRPLQDSGRAEEEGPARGGRGKKTKIKDKKQLKLFWFYICSFFPPPLPGEGIWAELSAWRAASLNKTVPSNPFHCMNINLGFSINVILLLVLDW